MHPTTKVYSVHEITHIFRELLESEPRLQDLWIEGEISNLARPPSGHIYFTLKDDESQIQCVIFSRAASRLEFSPKDGDAVRVHGKLSIYDVRSVYQIIGDWAEPAGVGALQLAFDRLKEKLAAEGLFDASRKKPPPKFPEKIGIITSATGAAIRDMLRMLQKRYPVVDVLLFPTLVQGEDAAVEIAHAIACMNRLSNVDLLIVGRGGGSIEDLWAFNEEIVARAISVSRIPIVSAIGHETDFTIADFVSDRRVPTPSAAIELIVPDRQELRQRMASFESHLKRNIAVRIESAQARLLAARNRISPVRQIDRLNRQQQMIDQLELRSQRATTQQLGHSRQQLDRLNTKLLHLNPLSQIQTLRDQKQMIDQLELRSQRALTHRLVYSRQQLDVLNTELLHLNPLSQIQTLRDQKQTIDQLELRSQRATLEYSRQQLDTLNTKLLHVNPLSQIQTLSNRLDRLTQSHQMHIRQQVFAKRQTWQMHSTRLNSLSPLGILARGYSICKDLNGKTITDASTVSTGDEVEVQLSRGWLACEILKGGIDD